MTAPLVIFCIGNPSRGDDALGPSICGQLGKWPEIANGQVELVEDFQLQIEHALDLVGRRLVLFIDAGINTPAPFDFRQISASTAVAHTSHALLPEAVLQVYRQTEGGEPPPAFVLCVRGDSFGLGEPLSPTAQAHAAAAIVFLRQLLASPEQADWLPLAGAVTGFRSIKDGAGE